jgi:CRP/FNR family transcriptional regulator, cyclic AMP receptor protein
MSAAGRMAVPKDPISIFRRFEVLKDVPDLALNDLARNCSWLLVPRGKNILLANEETTDVYFITAGKVRVILYSAVEGRQVLFANVGTHEIFGEVSAIDGKPRSAAIEADSNCELAVLKQEKFRQLLHNYPEFAFAVLVKLAKTVRRLSDRVFEFSTLDVESRIHAELLRCAVPDCANKGQALVLPTLRADFAARISTTREAVSRVITSLGEDGIVRREGQHIRVLDLERLSNLVIKAKGE